MLKTIILAVSILISTQTLTAQYSPVSLPLLRLNSKPVNNIRSGSTDLSNSIIAGYGKSPFAKTSEYTNIAISLKYFKKLKNNFIVGGGIDLYYIIVCATGMGYYDIPVIKNRIHILPGTGLTFGVGPEKEILIRPLASIKLDLHLSKLTVIGAELRNPFLFSKENQDYLKTTYLFGYFGFKF